MGRETVRLPEAEISYRFQSVSRRMSFGRDSFYLLDYVTRRSGKLGFQKNKDFA